MYEQIISRQIYPCMSGILKMVAKVRACTVDVAIAIQKWHNKLPQPRYYLLVSMRE